MRFHRRRPQSAPQGEPELTAGVDQDWLDERYAALRLALARDCKSLTEDLAAAGIPAANRPSSKNCMA